MGNEAENNFKRQTAFYVFVVLSVAAVVCWFAKPQFDRNNISEVAHFCRDVPFLIGSVAILVLWALFGLVTGKWNPLEVARGTDNRWSTSKFQFFLWTLVAIFSYISIFAALMGSHAWALASKLEMPTHLLLAMGLSVTTAVAAKGIMVSQLNNGAVKDHVAEGTADLGDLVMDDGKEIDLTKLQMLGWTVVAIGAYLANVTHLVIMIGRNQTPDPVKFPDIDMSLMVLMGLGQAAYLAKKTITSNTPTITKVEPATPSATKDIPLTISGSGFGVTQGTSTINLDGIAVVGTVTSWKDTEIKVTIPAASMTAGAKKLSLTIGTQNSNPIAFQAT